jgi:hypothetical protein
LPATHINTIDYLRRFNLILSDLRNQVNQPYALSGVRQNKSDFKIKLIGLIFLFIIAL